ncbi:MAG: hypothetical protein ACD_79C00941G0002 [uncultured bacterium]|nr:MAG: hypothetical protein ACD_79C00941G0002 [uncultured bacterium]
MNKDFDSIIEIENPDIDSSTEDYARRFHGEVGQWFLKVQEDATDILFPEGERFRVLDAGGGHAQNISILLKKNCDITVLGSDDSCALRLTALINNKSVKFVKGNLLKLPFEDKSFDLVIAYRMLTHLNNWKVFIKELTRVSKRTVIVDFPSVFSVNFLADMMFVLKKKIEKNTRTYKLFKEKDIVNEFKNNNFIPKGRVPQYLMPMVLYRAVKKKQFAVLIEKISKILQLTRLFGSPIIYRFDSKIE